MAPLVNHTKTMGHPRPFQYTNQSEIADKICRVVNNPRRGRTVARVAIPLQLKLMLCCFSEEDSLRSLNVSPFSELRCSAATRKWKTVANYRYCISDTVPTNSFLMPSRGSASFASAIKAGFLGCPAPGGNCLLLSFQTIALSSACEWTDRSVSSGRYCLSNQLALSFDSRRHGD